MSLKYKEVQEDTMGLFLTKQPYNLTVAKHTMDIHQMRIMSSLVHAMQPYMSMQVDYAESKQDVWLNLRSKDLVLGNNFNPLRESLKKLMKKVVIIKYYVPEKKTCIETGTTIVQEYKHEHGSSEVAVKISGSLLPQLIDLARGYTRYSLGVAFQTSSPNVFKIYQYISHFRDKKIIQCNVETLRKWLNLETKYKMPARIKERVLEPAMRELREKADVWFDIAKRVTDGRRMIGWKFNIYTKKAVKKTLDKHQHQPDSSPKAKPFGMCSELVSKFKLSERQADKLLQKVDTKDLHKELYQINLLILGGTLKNIGGYTAKMLAEKFNLRL